MHIMIAEKDEGKFESSEYKIICWVKNPNDLAEIESSANNVISKHIENTDREILFGNANILLSGKEIVTIGFKNSHADPEDMNEVLDLFELKEEIIH